MQVRPPAPGEEAALATMMRAMEAHYGNQVPPGIAEAAAASLCQGEGPGFCLVATDHQRLLGAAFYGTQFPGPALGRDLYLKDLFVLAEARGRGVGLALMRAVAADATGRGARRLEWSTGASNAAARRFYAGLGAIEPDKVVLALDAAGLRNLAAPLDRGPETGD